MSYVHWSVELFNFRKEARIETVGESHREQQFNIEKNNFPFKINTIKNIP